MLAIRLECNDGDGIFKLRGKYGLDLMTFPLGKKISHLHDLFPDPFMEFGNTFTEKHYCAYTSISQLLQWINMDELMELIDRGVNVYLLELRIYLKGVQICYKKKDIIYKWKINEIFKRSERMVSEE